MENNRDGTLHSEFKEILSRKVTSFINDEKNLIPKRMGRRVFRTPAWEKLMSRASM